MVILQDEQAADLKAKIAEISKHAGRCHDLTEQESLVLKELAQLYKVMGATAEHFAAIVDQRATAETQYADAIGVFVDALNEALDQS